MSQDREITIKVKLDGNNAVKGSAKVKQSIKGIDDQAGKASKGVKGFGLQTIATGAIAAAAFTKIAEYGTRAVKESFRLATAAEETGSKFKTVLGPNVAEATAFLDENATKMGLNVTQGQDLLATTTAIAQGFGFSGDAAADMGTDVVKLAGDLQSFNDVPIERTHNAITSALSGETEALKSLGIVVRQAEVNERALAQTGKEAADALTQQEKATATMTLITEKAGVAVGDLNRTQDSTANRARQARAEFENLQIALSKRLMPAFDGAVTIFGNLVGTLNDWLEVPVVEELQAQRDEFNALFTQATNVNTSQSERVRLIRQMKAEYPDFLGGINAETVSNKELRDVLKEVNDEYAERIKTQKIIVPVQEAYATALDRTRNVASKEADMLILLEKKYRENEGALKKLGFETENWRARLEEMNGEQAQQELTKVNVALNNWLTAEEAAARLARSTVSSGINPMTIALTDSKRAQDRLTEARKEAVSQLENLGYSQDRINEILSDYSLEAVSASGLSIEMRDSFQLVDQMLSGNLFSTLDDLIEKTGGSGGLNEQIKDSQEQLDAIINKTGTLTSEEFRRAQALQVEIEAMKAKRTEREKAIQLLIRQQELEQRDRRNEGFGIEGDDVEVRQEETTNLGAQTAVGEDPRIIAEQQLQDMMVKTGEVKRSVAEIATAATQKEIQQREQLAQAIGQNAASAIMYAETAKDALRGVIKGVINAIVAHWVKNALQTAGASGPLALALSAPLAAGAVKAGEAITRPLLSFQAGGVLSGPSHARGGIPVMNRGRQVAEAEGNEAIINTRSTGMFYDELSAINEAGGGSRFPGANRTIRLPAGFEMGGPLGPIPSGRTGFSEHFADRAIDSDRIAAAVRKGLEGANLVAPVQIQRFDEDLQDNRRIERQIGNDV